jgi:hypothetical protein
MPPAGVDAGQSLHDGCAQTLVELSRGEVVGHVEIEVPLMTPWATARLMKPCNCGVTRSSPESSSSTAVQTGHLESRAVTCSLVRSVRDRATSTMIEPVDNYRSHGSQRPREEQNPL